MDSEVRFIPRGEISHPAVRLVWATDIHLDHADPDRALGEKLYRIAGEHPDVAFTVLGGHTHGEGVARIRPNLMVHTQGAEYGGPNFRMVTADEEAVNVEGTRN